MHAQKVCEEFELKDLGEHHDLYVQSDTLLLADLFENFRINVLKYMSLILSLNFLSAPGFFICTSLFKKDRSTIRIINEQWYINDDWKRN